MKLWIPCAVAVLLWAGANALAQGKGQDKDTQARGKENVAKSNVPQPNAGAVEQADKDAAKGKKLEPPAEVADVGAALPAEVAATQQRPPARCPEGSSTSHRRSSRARAPRARSCPRS